MHVDDPADDLAKLLQKYVPTDCKISLYKFAAELRSTSKEPAQCHCFAAIQKACVIYAIEVIVYTGPHLVTLYVSKVDSTGCHDLTSSPITGITRAILFHLIAAQKTRVRLCLFARSQPQYIFPFSSKNKAKHVLDDGMLIKWWLKTVEHIRVQVDETNGRGYLLIPGEEKIVSTRRLQDLPSWSLGHPYNSSSLAINEITSFPDDPKARFMDELKSNKEDTSMTVAQFWELMAFRQEMSYGHAIGFIALEVMTKTDGIVRNAQSISLTMKRYKKLFEALQSGTYSTPEETRDSTSRWLQQVDLADIVHFEIEGKGTVPSRSSVAGATLDKTSSSVRYTKRKESESQVHTLIPRKKKKAANV